MEVAGEEIASKEIAGKECASKEIASKAGIKEKLNVTMVVKCHRIILTYYL